MSLIKSDVSDECVQALQQKALQKKALQQKALQQKALQQKALQQKALQQKALQQKALQQKALQQKKVTSLMKSDALQKKALQQKALQQKALQQKALQQKALQQKALQQKALQQKALQQKVTSLIKNDALQQKVTSVIKSDVSDECVQALQQKALQQKALQQKALQQKALQQKVTSLISFIAESDVCDECVQALQQKVTSVMSVCRLYSRKRRLSFVCAGFTAEKLLRRLAEHTLMDMVQLLFTRLPQFKEDPKWNANMKKLKMRTGGVDQNRLSRRKKSPKLKQKKLKPSSGPHQSVDQTSVAGTETDDPGGIPPQGEVRMNQQYQGGRSKAYAYAYAYAYAFAYAWCRNEITRGIVIASSLSAEESLSARVPIRPGGRGPTECARLQRTHCGLK
ncbi:hypothetical protein DPMN_181980 [Dreissena polymorpha]|uniref:Uncharacterized protein n=1 Tax=Dreissena polymorpha TaxID=45954 RepID=A0A9D4DF08_DREPO|nr:hypothetical protein DPMN_181980 [Dreissena polymorpha]